MAYQFGQEGLKPTPEKVQAIHEYTPLETKAEVRRFLGMTGNLSKYIPRYYEGLPAGLFQQSPKGCHSAHFITRTLNDVEKRYTQTKKGGLCVKWAKDRFSMHLLGAPRFTIVTVHEPLLPMFNKPTSKLPPRIEKWVMDMQYVDFEIKYEPGKDKGDFLKFLSTHRLPITGNDDTEKALKAIIVKEHAVVKVETQQNGNK